MVDPIPDEVLAAVRARGARRLGATICNVMAETDVGFDEMAIRTGVSESTLKRRLMRLMNGDGNMPLDYAAEMVFACGGCEIRYVAHRKTPEMTESEKDPS